MQTNPDFESEDEYPLTVDEILRLDNESEPIESEALEENNSDGLEPITKHTLVTSPWSRLGMIGIPLGAGFMVFFLLINSIVNGGNSAKNNGVTEKPESTERSPDEPAQSDDGDVYAQLALSKQADELDKLTSHKAQSKPTQTAVLGPAARPSVAVTSTQPRPPSPRTQELRTTTQAPRYERPSYPPPPRYERPSYSPPPRYELASYTRPLRTFTQNRAKYSVSTPQSTSTVRQAVDPISELNRLRGLGSFGSISYEERSETSTNALAPRGAKALATSAFALENPRYTAVEKQNTEQTDLETSPLDNGIEKIRPRWVNSQKSKEVVLATAKYIPCTSQGGGSRYLVVGQLANGELVTPLVKEQSIQPDSLAMRYLAKLTQDLHDNYGCVGIKRGSLVAVEVLSVDGGSNVKAQVTSIITDNTRISHKKIEKKGQKLPKCILHNNYSSFVV